WSNYICGYSFKTGSLPWALRFLEENGFYAEVVSEDEYRLAKHLGFDRVIYNGPVKGKESFFDALWRGAIINIDSKRELRWLKEYREANEGEEAKYKIGLRVNFDLESEVPETSAGTDGSRFGFSYENGEFAEALAELDDMQVPISGIHLHVGSKTRSIAIYEGIARMACKVKTEHVLELKYVDIGGGYFGGMDNRPKYPDYIKAVAAILSESFDPHDTTLIVEPGTSLITPPIDYMISVVDVKDTYAKRIVTVDGSRIDVDPLHTKSSYFHEIVYGESESARKRESVPEQVLCGMTCMENDRMMVLQDQPELTEGDRILMHKVGGYTMCLTPLFIRYFPTVYLEENGEHTVIREAWGPDEYCAKSSIIG
ncbi:MAG: pyridoxal-dependent decarboxylase, partial [Lachnospiraceae bacterium]|nr:pyridoxal-dependent decarboxylase [Lachnospiraceae bacterium]